MISITNLTKNYGPTRAVDNLSLEISRGEILGLLGPNGAGKSTTLRILTGYLKPGSGSVEVNGVNAADDPIKVKNMIGYLPESAPLYTDMLVYDYLDYIADLRGVIKENKLPHLKKLASLCGISDVMHKSIATLSKGYKQRVGLALALMNDPEILVLDEPTSGLDPNQIAEIRAIIKEIGKEKTVIFSTHILSEAEATCDRVVIINKGKLAAYGPSGLLSTSREAERTLSLKVTGCKAGAVKPLFESIDGILSIEISDENDSEADPVSVSILSSRDVREDVYRLVKKTDWMLMEFLEEKKSLEHVFRELTMEDKA
ncbi:MAG: ATP-binding cassette domain-containing protein [Spirochaetales bacterium]|nr:ATP-binding cassette domain-containing protein [Spirochaetales bacterium]